MEDSEELLVGMIDEKFESQNKSAEQVLEKLLKDKGITNEKVIEDLIGNEMESCKVSPDISFGEYLVQCYRENALDRLVNFIQLDFQNLTPDELYNIKPENTPIMYDELIYELENIVWGDIIYDINDEEDEILEEIADKLNEKYEVGFADCVTVEDMEHDFIIDGCHVENCSFTYRDYSKAIGIECNVDRYLWCKERVDIDFLGEIDEIWNINMPIDDIFNNSEKVKDILKEDIINDGAKQIEKKISECYPEFDVEDRDCYNWWNEIEYFNDEQQEQIEKIYGESIPPHHCYYEYFMYEKNPEQ